VPDLSSRPSPSSTAAISGGSATPLLRAASASAPRLPPVHEPPPAPDANLLPVADLDSDLDLENLPPTPPLLTSADAARSDSIADQEETGAVECVYEHEEGVGLLPHWEEGVEEAEDGDGWHSEQMGLLPHASQEGLALHTADSDDGYLLLTPTASS
jgi:hypothetical protein